MPSHSFNHRDVNSSNVARRVFELDSVSSAALFRLIAIASKLNITTDRLPKNCSSSVPLLCFSLSSDASSSNGFPCRVLVAYSFGTSRSSGQYDFFDRAFKTKSHVILCHQLLLTFKFDQRSY